MLGQAGTHSPTRALDDVASIGGCAGRGVDRLEDVLENRLLVPEELPGLPIEFPEDTWLANREHQLAAVEVDQHALENFVEVERLAWRVLEVPGERPVIRVERHGRTRIQRAVERGHAATCRHPGFGLRRSPVGEV